MQVLHVPAGSSGPTPLIKNIFSELRMDINLGITNVRWNLLEQCRIVWVLVQSGHFLVQSGIFFRKKGYRRLLGDPLLPECYDSQTFTIPRRFRLPMDLGT
jgi:hypothetical protein